jgi:hypothetical protein
VLGELVPIKKSVARRINHLVSALNALLLVLPNVVDYTVWIPGQKRDEQVAHPGNIINASKAAAFRLIW